MGFKLLFYYFYPMHNSSLSNQADPRLQNFIRQYSTVLTPTPTPTLTLTRLQKSGNNTNPRSAIQQMIYRSNKYRSNPQQQSMRPILVNTQQRIFSQVVNLMMEINAIKNAIQKEVQCIQEMEVERDRILGKSVHKQAKKPSHFDVHEFVAKIRAEDSQQIKISSAQLQQLTAQNQSMTKQIQRLQIQQSGNLKQALYLQQEKYQTLLEKLQQQHKTNSSLEQTLEQATTPELLKQAAKLQEDIRHLEQAIQEGSSLGLQMKKLSQENQRLQGQLGQLIERDARNPRELEQEQEECRRLEEYIRMEDQNKILFFEDLRKFKEEYHQLQQQNQQLKSMLKKTHSNRQSQPTPTPSSKKLQQYHQLMQEMAKMLK